jgi:hypothetical protein
MSTHRENLPSPQPLRRAESLGNGLGNSVFFFFFFPMMSLCPSRIG